MIEVTCPECKQTRQVKSVFVSSGLCRSCSKKKLARENRIQIAERRCKFCGELFIPSSNNQWYCKRPHYRTCPVCGKEYLEDNVDNLKRPPVACSYACRVARTQSTSLEKYGCTAPGNNETAREKAKQTMRENYGVDYAMQSPELRQKASEKMIERYGEANAAHVPELLQKRMEHMRPFWISNGCISQTNKRFAEKLEASGLSVQLEYQIGTKFFDIAIPDKRIVIEIDPTYTHNDLGNHWGPGIDKYYHINKTKTAAEHGYRCIHVWDWDDWDKIVAMVQPTKRVHARECTVYRLWPKYSIPFIQENHLQGSCRGQLLYLGLVKDDQIFQVMTFGRSRYDSKYDVELLRMCTKIGYHVAGGASRLFKYATEKFDIQNIVSYCDLSKFSGKTYQIMGMTHVRDTQPQMIWSKENKKVTSNLLRARGYDQLFGTNYGKGTSNEVLMIENGWLPVFDCGQRVYEYK